MASFGGHKGGLTFPRLLAIIERAAYKQVHVAWNERGAKAGLPPDVATVQIGKPRDGYWWNVRRSVVPEYSIRTKARTEYNKEVMDILNRGDITWDPANGDPSAKSALMSHLEIRIPSQLQYVGWRETLRGMLMRRRIRETDEVREMLGIVEFHKIVLARKIWEAANEIEITAD